MIYRILAGIAYVLVIGAAVPLAGTISGKWAALKHNERKMDKMPKVFAMWQQCERQEICTLCKVLLAVLIVIVLLMVPVAFHVVFGG